MLGLGSHWVAGHMAEHSERDLGVISTASGRTLRDRDRDRDCWGRRDEDLGWDPELPESVRRR